MALFRCSSGIPVGTALKSDVTAGKTFSSQPEGVNATGILADWRSTTKDIDLSEIKEEDSVSYAYLRPTGDARVDTTSLFRIARDKIAGGTKDACVEMFNRLFYEHKILFNRGTWGVSASPVLMITDGVALGVEGGFTSFRSSSEADPIDSTSNHTSRTGRPYLFFKKGQYLKQYSGNTSVSWYCMIGYDNQNDYNLLTKIVNCLVIYRGDTLYSSPATPIPMTDGIIMGGGNATVLGKNKKSATGRYRAFTSEGSDGSTGIDYCMFNMEDGVETRTANSDSGEAVNLLIYYPLR